ncbi:hypothetical protein vseg_003164 [Gypsophila vaccaria]
MDPNPTHFPILSYVMSRLPSLRHPTTTTTPTTDIEQPPPSTAATVDPTFEDTLTSRMPHLKDPAVISAMSAAVSEIAQTRSILTSLGPRPDHETLDIARAKLADMEALLAAQMEEVSLSPRGGGGPTAEESEREKLEREKTMYKAIVQIDEMHDAYEKLLRNSEEKLMSIYDSAVVTGGGGGGGVFSVGEVEDDDDEVDEDVVRVLKEEGGERVDLSGKKLRILPDAFGRLKRVLTLNLSSNQLQGIPDSISGMENLEELNLSSNTLQSLPDSIGLLMKLKILNVSGNKLTALPDSICHCVSLVELDASFNHLGYLPTNIGYELVNLRKLLVPYNKIRSLPTSVGEMKSLQNLDLHFNELHGLPVTIGKLTTLVTLNLSGNFSDLKELPETFGDLLNLEELDLSHNQIHMLPYSFCKLEKLRKLNLDQNPIVIPPPRIVSEGVQAVKIFMAKEWAEFLREEEERSRQGTQELSESGWLKRSVSKLNTVVSSVSGYLAAPTSPHDPCLDEER